MPIITAWTTLFCGLLFMGLTWRVIGARRASGVSLGHGDNDLVLRRIRGQANAAEQMPMTLLALLMAELQTEAGILLALFALIFCIGRALHGTAFGWMSHSPALRLVGMASSLAGTGLILVYLGVSLILPGV